MVVRRTAFERRVRHGGTRVWQANIKQFAEVETKQPVTDIVLSVPLCFTETQRQGPSRAVHPLPAMTLPSTTHGVRAAYV